MGFPGLLILELACACGGGNPEAVPQELLLEMWAPVRHEASKSGSSCTAWGRARLPGACAVSFKESKKISPGWLGELSSAWTAAKTPVRGTPAAAQLASGGSRPRPFWVTWCQGWDSLWVCSVAAQSHLEKDFPPEASVFRVESGNIFNELLWFTQCSLILWEPQKSCGKWVHLIRLVSRPSFLWICQQPKGC